MIAKETAAQRRARFQDWCEKNGYTYRISTQVEISGDFALAKATVAVFGEDKLTPIYKADGHKMMHFKPEAMGVKDTSAYSASETIAISRAIGFIMPGVDEITVQEDINDLIIYTLKMVGEKFGISEYEAKRYVEGIDNDSLREIAAKHLSSISAKAAISKAAQKGDR